MGRYGKELGALESDPAGKYLDGARQKRKELKQSSQTKLSGAGFPSDAKLDSILSAWPSVYLSSVVAERGGTIEGVVLDLLSSLPLGGRLAFRSSGKEERAIIHNVAHKVSGLWKNSYADPEAGGSARMVCIERIQNIAAEVSKSRVAHSCPSPSQQSCTQLDDKIDALTQLFGDAELGSASRHEPGPRKRRWNRTASSTTSAFATTAPNPEGAEDANSKIVDKVALPLASLVEDSTLARQQALGGACMTDLASIPGSVCVVWLRDDMRLKDNPALLRAAEGGFDVVVPVFVHDEAESKWNPHSLTGAGKVWKHESLQRFACSLGKIGSRLVLRQARQGAGVLGELLSLFGEPDNNVRKTYNGATSSKPMRLVVFNRLCEPWHYAHDQQVSAGLTAAGIAVETFAANILYEPLDLQPIERWQRWRARVRTEEGEARGVKTSAKDLEHISGFGSYRFFSHALEELGPPPRPCAEVRSLPTCPAISGCSLEDLGFGRSTGHGFPKDFSQFSQGSICKDGRHEREHDWARELRQWWEFGEEAGLHRLDEFLETVLATGDFEGRKRLLANSRNTSQLSPHIRFGEISARMVYWSAKQRKERTNQKLFEHTGYEYVGRHGRTFKGNPQEPAKANSTFIRRFIWRDLAYWFLWEFPTLPSTSLRPQYEAEVWSGTRAQLRHWQRGTTGFPLVDAAMRQLWAVGWMPNYLRHVVAQTLVEYLDVSWKHGLRWFDYTLVDIDVAINSFMWQNGGHSGPDHWEFVLHPVNAAKSCDPDGSYVRRWLPFLAECPDEFIHKPWDLPPRIFRLPSPGIYPRRSIIKDLDEARRSHLRNVLEVRRKHPEMVSRTGHEWLKLPGRGGLLAKCVTRLEFRAETEDFLLYQGPQRGVKKTHSSRSRDMNGSVLAEMMERSEHVDSYGPRL